MNKTIHHGDTEAQRTNDPENKMKSTTSSLLFICMTLGQVALCQTTLSPAEQSVAAADRLIAKNGKDFEAYNALALALSRRARETSDPNYYAQAEDALKKSFEISPGNFDGERTAVWLLLGKHEFPAALEKAKGLNKKMPDDVMIYGFLTDANVELGNYDDAEKAAQWMLNLRPGNMPGITRAAYLRELFGDIDGSLDLMNMAYQSTPPSETEDRAWILSQIGHLQLTSGKISEADVTLQQALALFPRYHYALQNLAKVRIEQKRYADAVTLLQQRYDDAHHAENLYDLAEAEELAGQSEEAKRDFAEFEIKSLAESVKKDNSSRELVFYYADHAHEPAEALKVAEQEFDWRHDVFTQDAYAWALHVNGRDAEAREHVETAIAVGIRDARMLRHAGEITLALGDRVASQKYLRQSAELNAPGSRESRQLLATLSDAAEK
jgi:tetratricopeptide (TPR) repeat protein